MSRSALGIALLAAVALSACATTLPPFPLDGRDVEPDPAERALWATALREGEALLGRVRGYDDPALAAWLLSLATGGGRLAGGPHLRIAIVRDPTLNAFALPDGLLIVHTGLLAAVDTPGALALVLGREVAHVTHRHARATAVDGRTPAAPRQEAAPLGPVATAIVGLHLGLATTASLGGYTRAREEQADAVALDRLGTDGWDVTQAASVFADLARGSGQRGTFEAFLLGRPTWLLERHASLQRRLATATVPVPTRGRADFDERLRPLVRENAAEDIRLGRFALARQALERVLAATPTDALAHVYYGDLHRLQGQRATSAEARQSQLDQARAHYRRAAAFDPALATPHRQLGLLHYEQRELADARAELERYLALAPDAADAARVADYVRELSR